ncbi:ADP-ribose pyrophosphatase YjhB, NUDIX family [Microlunatus sagamiharensis]|uniref:ADP-ribose pyrophosphatase YjhB, NUDIX family n=1 Tax=Microlunatus sagamiharensis TaxID=546874 RepID=A0A1H2N689_9ACTN|nr:NUDIX domain-containing protein [Microlunatus sagamiharensis]SDV00748.1 ADP-ribose pyrophosphatase YjhB, NUDIX family [Microlunatus sagamiharensis]
MTETIAIVALIEDGRLMLGHRRPARRWYPDCWDLFGGHVEPGESPEQAARRECREEIGVEVLDLHPIEATLDDPAIVAHAFLARRWVGEPVNAEPDEHDAVSWFTAAELPRLRLAQPSYLQWLAGLLERESPPKGTWAEQ